MGQNEKNVGLIIRYTYLGFGSDTSDFNVTETEIKETVDGFRVLVKTGRNTDGIFQSHAEKLYSISA